MGVRKGREAGCLRQRDGQSLRCELHLILRSGINASICQPCPAHVLSLNHVCWACCRVVAGRCARGVNGSGNAKIQLWIGRVLRLCRHHARMAHCLLQTRAGDTGLKRGLKRGAISVWGRMLDIAICRQVGSCNLT